VVTGTVAAPLGPGRYLLIDPKGAGLPLRPGGAVQTPLITYWAEAHPVLRRVVLSDVTLAEATATPLPVSATVLVRSLTTPLLFTLVDEGRRFVWMTFDPSNSNLPLRVGFPVLLYNAIAWLAEAGQREAANDYTFLAQAAVQVIGPDGKSTRKEPVDGRIALDPAVPGFYRVTSASGAPLQTIAASVVSAQETRIAPQPDLGSAPALPYGRFRDREVQAPLTLLALLLLLAEWAFFHRRVTV
jgi:hypothetical protein